MASQYCFSTPSSSSLVLGQPFESASSPPFLMRWIIWDCFLLPPEPLLSQSLRLMRGEGEIAEPLGALAERYPALSIGSYPFQRDGIYGANIVIRGTNGVEVDAAMTELSKLFPA